MKKLRVFAVMVAMLISSLFLGTGLVQAEDVEITLYGANMSAEGSWQEVIGLFEEEHPNTKIEFRQAQPGVEYIQRYESLQASGNPPTIAMLEPSWIMNYKDTYLNLESEKEKYKELALPGTIERNLIDGQFIGIPFTTQGYGLLYNEDVIEEVLGKPFDPADVKTRNDLEKLFKKIDAAGIPPVMIHGANWSLGSHFMWLGYALQSENTEETLEFLDDLKKGKVDLETNKVMNGLLDTFDLFKKYNIRKNDPLVADNQKDSMDFGRGKTAFYFNGDWEWSWVDAPEDGDDNFGVMPVPISNNPDEYGNNEVPVIEPFLAVIDDTKATSDQQQLAKDFLEWMVSSKEAQTVLISKMGNSMPYKDLKVESDNQLSQAISKYVEQGNVINLEVFKHMPGDHYSKVGASMQKYLVDVVDRQGLFEEIENYWEEKGNN